jgi:hypothetical protein
MSSGASTHFRVISADDHGDLVRCSYCGRGMKHVVVLPLTARPELESRSLAADGEELWVGLCAYCVLALAEALARAEGKPP